MMGRPFFLAVRGPLLGPQPLRPIAMIRRAASESLDLVDGNLAATTIFLGVERHLLAFAQTANARALESRRMDEYVLAAIFRLNKAEALLIVVEFHCASLHFNTLRFAIGFLLARTHAAPSERIDFWR